MWKVVKICDSVVKLSTLDKVLAKYEQWTLFVNWWLIVLYSSGNHDTWKVGTIWKPFDFGYLILHPILWTVCIEQFANDHMWNASQKTFKRVSMWKIVKQKQWLVCSNWEYVQLRRSDSAGQSVRMIWTLDIHCQLMNVINSSILLIPKANEQSKRHYWDVEAVVLNHCKNNL